MVSLWQLPLPTEEYTNVRVVVCFYNDRWIPISCFSYNEAIALYHKALLKGMEILVFPTGLDLETKNILLTESSWKPDKFASKLACGYTSRVGLEQVTDGKVNNQERSALTPKVRKYRLKRKLIERNSSLSI